MGWKENIRGLNSKQVDEIWQENKKINFYQSLKVWEKQLMTWLELMIYDWGGRWWFVWLDKSSVQDCWSIVGQIKESKGGRVNAVCTAYYAVRFCLHWKLALPSSAGCVVVMSGWELWYCRALGLVVVIGLAVAGLVWPGGEPTSSWSHSANGTGQ